MKTFNIIYISLIVISALIGIILILNNWISLGLICIIISISNVINILDIMETNKEDMFINDPGNMRRRAYHYLKMKEKEKKEREYHKDLIKHS